MSHRITIQFPADRDNSFYFRVFCWADDTLYLGIDMAGLGIVHGVDHVRETVRIDVAKTSHLGRVMGLIKKTLPQHFPGWRRYDREGVNGIVLSGRRRSHV